MMPVLRAVLIGSAALALALPLSAAHAQTVPVWPQVHSDIRPDPNVRFGQLPNGMRYMLQHNATPPHETAIRLRIASGSFEEKDDQQGLAHFLEHMAFKGSAHVPEGEMVKLLQRHGLAFGADTNASTNFTQTVYQLDLPESDESSLDLGLMLMRETASELTLSQAAMDPERGVVLSEERLRDTPGYEAAHQRQAFLMKGQLAPDRWPIGKVDVIRTAPASRLRAFYEANYRPERATLVVVGDFDLDAMEAKIKARFKDWTGTGPATAEPVYGPVRPRDAETQVIVLPGTTTAVSISWTKPHDPSADTRAKERRDIVEGLGINIVNHRLERLAREDNPPYLGASVGRSDQLNSINVAALAVTPKGEDWQGALNAADAVRRQVLQYGVQPAELVRVITESRARLRGLISAAPTRRSPLIAQQMVAVLDTDEVYCGPVENARLFEEAAKDLKPEQVDAALRQAFTGNGPLVSMVTPKPLPGGEAALLAGFKSAEAAPVKPGEVFADKAWPYARFGRPGVVVEKQDLPDYGVTFVRFANGVRLAFKQTDFSKDQILVSANIPGGLLTLPKDRPNQLWTAGALTLGGMRQISLEDADQVLAGKVYNFAARVGEDDFVLAGATRRVDLDLEMQVITAFLSDPGWRPSGLERLRSAGLVQLAQLDSTPASVLSRKLEQLLHDGDPRWANPNADSLKAGSLADAHAIWNKALAEGPIDVTMVGDLSLDQAIAAVGKTLGSLPPRGEPQPLAAGARVVRFPAPTPTPVRLTHKGRADQAIAYIAWPEPDFFADPKEARAISLAVQVMQGRLIERLRIAEGATYSPTAAARPSDTFPGYGVISASVETPPSKIDGFFREVSAITRELREKSISTDEFERAKRPRVEQIEKSQVTNAYWVGRLNGAIEDRRRLELAHQTLPSYQSLTLADIQAAARKYLRDETAFRIEVVPEAKAAGPVPPPAP